MTTTDKGKQEGGYKSYNRPKTTRQNFTSAAFTEQERFEIYRTVARFMSEMISESNMLV
jgi:hypothetical protein